MHRTNEPKRHHMNKGDKIHLAGTPEDQHEYVVGFDEKGVLHYRHVEGGRCMGVIAGDPGHPLSGAKTRGGVVYKDHLYTVEVIQSIHDIKKTGIKEMDEEENGIQAELEQYAQLEGAEAGEALRMTLDLWSRRDYLSDELIASLELELLEFLMVFRSTTIQITETTTHTRNNTYLEEVVIR